MMSSKWNKLVICGASPLDSEASPEVVLISKQWWMRNMPATNILYSKLLKAVQLLHYYAIKTCMRVLFFFILYHSLTV